jgi:hypothetical protein
LGIGFGFRFLIFGVFGFGFLVWVVSEPVGNFEKAK